MTKPIAGHGTQDDPWVLTTPPGTSSCILHRDDGADPPLLVRRVGATLTYLARAVDDLHVYLEERCAPSGAGGRRHPCFARTCRIVPSARLVKGDLVVRSSSTFGLPGPDMTWRVTDNASPPSYQSTTASPRALDSGNSSGGGSSLHANDTVNSNTDAGSMPAYTVAHGSARRAASDRTQAGSTRPQTKRSATAALGGSGRW